MESGDSEGGGVENDEKNVELRAANPWRTFQILGVKKTRELNGQSSLLPFGTPGESIVMALQEGQKCFRGLVPPLPPPPPPRLSLYARLSMKRKEERTEEDARERERERGGKTKPASSESAREGVN